MLQNHQAGHPLAQGPVPGYASKISTMTEIIHNLIPITTMFKQLGSESSLPVLCQQNLSPEEVKTFIGPLRNLWSGIRMEYLWIR